MAEETSKPSNFVKQIIDEDLHTGKHDQIRTRFPPEPNGYLHIGHAKAICLNFSLAKEYGGTCNLRFDDTNPAKEDVEYIDAIKEDIEWLGWQWDNLHNASDYFDKLYDYAVTLIKDEKAYICELSPEQMREYRGTLKEPGKPSPYRDRSVEENLALFTKMRDGGCKEGEAVLRVKIDMASPNINMRDPVIYRVVNAVHPKTGDKWKIYPMYDYTHCLSDAQEKITHSLCSLEFEDHRPLYNWFLEQLPTPSQPRQIEFARLFLNYTVMSKRKLRALVEDNLVRGWDDPRMPTLSGYRRRGYTPASIRNFCERIGLSKANSQVDVGMLEHAIREDLEQTAPRAMCVIDPIKVTLTNVEPGTELKIKAPVHQKKPEMGERELIFSRELLIDREDFMEDPPKKFFRLAPEREVRLRNCYIIKCNEVIKDDAGQVTELRCTIDPETLGKNPEGRKVKGIIHWVSAKHSVPVEARLYDRLFTDPNPDRKDAPDFRELMNPKSLVEMKQARGEPGLATAKAGDRYQFERQGYFAIDPDSEDGKLVVNRTVTLRDTWKN